jgi:hypothetical protein
MQTKQPEVIDELIGFDEDYTDSVEGTRLVIKRTQDIPDEHVATLKREKIDTLHSPTGDFYRVASIPTSIVQKWAREGFVLEDVLKQGPNGLRDILKRLNKESLDAFITTRKRF